jgi:hypothetical protein
VVYKLNTKKGNIPALQYSKSKFGRDAEITIALHIISKGWDVKFSRGSRGPADLYASKESEEWYIQVKASTKAPRIKGSGVLSLEKLALSAGACPVLALLQPSINSNPVLSSEVLRTERTVNEGGICGSEDLLQQFYLSFYNLVDWSKLEP